MAPTKCRQVSNYKEPLQFSWALYKGQHVSQQTCKEYTMTTILQDEN